MADKTSPPIHVFICEDYELGRELVRKYLQNGRITYAAIFDREERGAVAAGIDEMQGRFG